MLPLRRLFEVVGAQLTPREVAKIWGLLEETLPPPPNLRDPSFLGGGEGEETPPPSPSFPSGEFWGEGKIQKKGKKGQNGVCWGRGGDGVELLREMERRGVWHEGNLRPLGGLLRRVARHDLLRCLTLRRPRPVSPERSRGDGEDGGRRSAPRRWETGSSPGKRKRRSRPLPPPRAAPPPTEPPPEPPAKVTCDIRLRVRAEFCEHDSVLRRSVVSSRPRGPGRQLDVFGQASGVLKSRDLGSILCDIKFSELSYLEAFWGDYLSGALGAALEGVFLTEGLRRAVGRERLRLLVSVDQDDYEEGRRVLLGARGEGGGE